MSRIQLTQQINVSRVEDYLDLISEQPEQDVETYGKIKGAVLGGEAALIQFLMTWSERHPAGRLLLRGIGKDSDLAHEIEQFSKRAYGFVAMLMAGDVLTAENQSCRKQAYQACQAWVDRVTASPSLGITDENQISDKGSLEKAIANAVYGHRTFLPCVDHSTKGLITPFYHANGAFRERSEFRRFAELLIGRRSEQFVEENQSELDGLGAILFELMHNTHDWARSDVDEVPLRKSIRGILFTRLYLPIASIHRAAGTNTKIADYMLSVGERRPDQYVHLAELSVIDAGPGLAARWMSRQEGESKKTIEDEHAACISCLGLHCTSSSESYRGVGLFDVMNTLDNLSALVRVRTGRVAMLRDFIASPLGEKERSDGPRLPLSPEHRLRPVGMAPTAGTVFTILFPLK
ncbi:hypothetical protein [Novipirellula aureliae]|nr:hypothetical protein [Novipirellula aureliae]